MLILNCSVGPRLLMLKKVVESLIDVGMLVSRKGVELNSRVVGLKSVVVVNAVVAKAVDPGDAVVD